MPQRDWITPPPNTKKNQENKENPYGKKTDGQNGDTATLNNIGKDQIQMIKRK